MKITQKVARSATFPACLLPSIHDEQVMFLMPEHIPHCVCEDRVEVVVGVVFVGLFSGVFFRIQNMLFNKVKSFYHKRDFVTWKVWDFF